MTREVCGMCWCPYGDEGRCACPVEEEVFSKPVAWGMHDIDGNIYDCISAEEHSRHEGYYTIPLYTHPVKQLSDEEIMEICITGGVYDCINDPYIQKDGTCSLDKDLIRFARAIIKEITE